MLSFAGAFSLDAGTSSYTKGQIVSIEGDCLVNQKISISITMSEKQISNLESYCSSNRRYSAAYSISISDPSGEWAIAANSGRENYSRKIQVSNTANTGAYKITFISPVPKDYARMTDLAIIVKLSNGESNIDDADVYFWNAYGQKTKMQFESDGRYIYDYEIPQDASPGQWNLLVTAEGALNGMPSGGESTEQLNILVAPVIVKILEPVLDTYYAGEDLPVKVEASYYNGKHIINPEISASINQRKIPLVNVSGNIYEGHYQLQGDEEGKLSLVISATDNGSNYGNAAKDLSFFGGFIYFLSQNWLPIIVFLAAIIFLSYYLYTKFGDQLILMKYQSDLSKEKSFQKQLQTKYFKQSSISKTYYDSSHSKVNEKIASLSAKIRKIEQKLGTRHGLHDVK